MSTTTKKRSPHYLSTTETLRVVDAMREMQGISALYPAQIAEILTEHLGFKVTPANAKGCAEAANIKVRAKFRQERKDRVVVLAEAIAELYVTLGEDVPSSVRAIINKRSPTTAVADHKSTFSVVQHIPQILIDEGNES